MVPGYTLSHTVKKSSGHLTMQKTKHLPFDHQNCHIFHTLLTSLQTCKLTATSPMTIYNCTVHACAHFNWDLPLASQASITCCSVAVSTLLHVLHPWLFIS